MSKNQDERKKYILLLILFYVTYFLIFPRREGHSDFNYWREWSLYIFNNGLDKIYHSDTNYLPLLHYIFWVYVKIQGSVEAIIKNIHLLKAIVLVFDFIAGIFLIKILQEKEDNHQTVFINSLFYFLNIFLLYNTLFWGQVDGILACFVFASFYFGYKHRILPSLICFILALNLKLQAIIFVPFLGLILLPKLIKQFSFKKILLWFSTTLIFEFIILLPFILDGSLVNVWKVVTGSMGFYPVISANAYNIWYLLISGNPGQQSSLTKFLGLTYDSWGLIMFSITSFIALYPLLVDVFKSIKAKISVRLSIDKLLIIGALIPLVFFYFNTQMHERYSHPAFIFLITYCILQKRPWLGALASITYFLNLEKVLHYFNLHNYGTAIFSPYLISPLYLLIIIALYFALYEVQIPKLSFKLISRKR